MPLRASKVAKDQGGRIQAARVLKWRDRTAHAKAIHAALEQSSIARH